ncbi:MYCBP-associated protein isoform X1 [Tachysurus ichikawai]
MLQKEVSMSLNSQYKKRGKASDESQCAVNERQCMSSTVYDEDPNLATRPKHLQKPRAPRPPKDSQKPRETSRVPGRKTRPKNADLQPLDYTGPGGPRFDSQGMVLPHSILGSLEDFRKEMEARGEVELVKRIPDVQKQQKPSGFKGQKPEEKPKSRLLYEQDQQGRALNHWCYRMAERRRQLNFISSES